ncbi:MAG: hypothetical protein JWN45_2545 [Acidobacteriaceae bacterium]|nr:hypothetical protein [Acidobacteriaceae bacterium]
MANPIYNDKTLTQLLQEVKDELRDFATTRYEMLMVEIKEKLRVWKLSLPMLAVAALLAFGAFMTITFGLVALIGTLIGTDYAYAWGALAVSVLYLIVAGIFGYLGYREITAEGMKPTRTLEVLKQDQQWIKDETRAA